MRRVIIESPYKGATVADSVANIEYARQAVCDVSIVASLIGYARSHEGRMDRPERKIWAT